MVKEIRTTSHKEERTKTRCNIIHADNSIPDGGSTVRYQCPKEQQSSIDDMLCEQMKKFGPETIRCLLQIINSILRSHKCPKLWRKLKVIAILKIGNTVHYLKGVCEENEKNREFALPG